MRTVPRTRHYVSPGALTLCRPVFSFNYTREAYVLRGIGDRIGPVLREERRRRPSANGYQGPERRGTLRLARTEAAVRVTSRPAASSPRAASSARSMSSATASRPEAVGQTRTKAGRRARSKDARA